MSVLDKVIELIFRSPSRHLTVEFQGGEPLLAFEKVQYAVEKILWVNKNENRDITFVLCTNLCDISETQLEFCKRYQVLISTSLDGPKFIHNLNRQSPDIDSYEMVKTNIKLCREALGQDMVSALMTTPPTSLRYAKEIVDEYVAQGFSSIFLRQINPYGLSKKHRLDETPYIDRFLEFYKRAMLYIISLNKEGLYFVEDHASIILSKILTPFPVGFTDLQSPSGVVNSVIVYNYDGNVYASDESRMLAEEGDFAFRLGHVQSASYQELFYGEKAKAIAEYWSNECLPGCSECAFMPYCGADPVRNYATQGDMVGFRPTNGFCRKNKEMIRFLFEIMHQDPEVEKIFRGWINRTHALSTYVPED